ncbi:MAG: response regulator [Desulfuromonadaceae bacterium]|jgi:HD-like signal output (HDOD) protein/CheY-like chemotaxis protein
MTDRRPGILFVDDEPNILRSLRRLFMDEDYELHFAESAAEGLNILQQETIDLVVSDVRMPKMSGIEFLARIKEDYPQIGRILLSGYAEKSCVIKAMAEGCAQQMLSKPWDEKELKEVLHEALKQLNRQEKAGVSTQSLVNSLANLQPLPQIYHDLRACLADEDNFTIDQVEGIVRQDAAACADLLRWANSAMFGQRGKVETLRRAIMLLGTDVVESLILSMAIERTIAPRVEGFDLKGLQRHAMGCAQVARWLALQQPETDRELADQAFIAGLLHDIGVLAAAGVFSESFGRVIALARERRIPLAEAEDEILETNHTIIGSILADWWTLPKFIGSVVRWHLQPEKAKEHQLLVEIVALANVLSYEFGFGFNGSGRPPVISEKLLARYSLTSDKIAALREQLADAV